MATLGDKAHDVWTNGSCEDLGNFVDALRSRHPGTFATQNNVLLFFQHCLRTRGAETLPTLADLDARLYASEHNLEL